MSNSLGKIIRLSIFGESHGGYVGALLDGIPAGIPVSHGDIASALAKRRPSLNGETKRVEPDEFILMSGVFKGFTNGEPIAIAIPNVNTHSADYEKTALLARPSHADYVSHEKNHGFEDYRGGGHFSGRITAGIVAAGAIAQKALEQKGILVGAHIARIGDAKDEPFDDLDPKEQIKAVNDKPFPVISSCQEEMERQMDLARSSHDSVGGEIELAISGLPVGVGEPWFGSLDGTLSNAIMSIGGVKGVSFGAGFEVVERLGSENNDEFENQNGHIVTTTNSSGGVNGGISNGMPVIVHIAVKPTPSISLDQDTIDMDTKRNAEISIVGRHDPCIVRRIVPVINAIASIVICDLLAQKEGRDALR